MNVKLINLNIWHGGWRLWDNILAYLKAEQPDIVMLQEVFMSGESNVAPYLKTVESLKNEIGLLHDAQAAEFILHTGRETAPMGNAIMSRFPLKNRNIHWVHGSGSLLDAFDDSPELFSRFPRNLVHATVSIEEVDYELMTVHGVWAPDGNETDDQKAMGKKISEYIQNKSNVILSGDFNINQKSECISGIEKDLTNIFKDERITSFNMKHKDKPGYASAVVDFVFASPAIKVLEHRTADVDVSDHQSQVVVFDL